MASVNKDAKGWRIMYLDHHGDRRQMRPGKKTNKATAEQISRHVEALVGYRAGGSVSMPRQTAMWLADIGDGLRSKLENAGLIDPVPDVVPEPEPKPEEKTLAEFLDDHVEHGRTAKGTKASKATKVKWNPTVKFLKEQLPDKLLREVTAEDAYQFKVWLDNRRIKQKTAGRKGEPMTENAKRRHIATCKMLFNAAKRRGLVDTNPFDAQVSGTQPNRSRDFFVTPEMTTKLLAAAPDAQWRLLIALWRLAGLRKMEVFRLTWGDVLWDAGKLRVRSSKTAHIDGCDYRFVPIRDIRQYLEDAFQAALPAGSGSLPADAPIVTRFSATNSNLDKPFRQIVEAAGLTLWPKLFQNMRASCETQWLRDGERHDLVANWIGHSVKVQRQHYVQHTNDDVDAFNRKPAFEGGNICGNIEPRNAAQRGKEATPVTTGSGSKNTDRQRFSTSNAHVSINPARVRTDQCFSTSNEPGPESGNTGGNISPDFLATFSDLLAADGFSPDDVRRTISVLQACAAVMDHAETTQATGTR